MRTTVLTVDEMKAKLTRYNQICLEMAERETDEAMVRAHLKDAQEALVKYRLLTTTLATCPKCGGSCDWETFHNVDSCYPCYRLELGENDAPLEIVDPYDVL